MVCINNDLTSSKIYDCNKHNKKVKTKKANHKHIYKNCVVITNGEGFHIISACVVCGKIGPVCSDSVIDSKFPNVYYNNICGFKAGSEEEFKIFKEWCLKNYKVVYSNENNIFKFLNKNKYI